MKSEVRILNITPVTTSATCDAITVANENSSLIQTRQKDLVLNSSITVSGRKKLLITIIERRRERVRDCTWRVKSRDSS